MEVLGSSSPRQDMEKSLLLLILSQDLKKRGIRDSISLAQNLCCSHQES